MIGNICISPNKLTMRMKFPLIPPFLFEDLARLMASASEFDTSDSEEEEDESLVDQDSSR